MGPCLPRPQPVWSQALGSPQWLSACLVLQALFKVMFRESPMRLPTQLAWNRLP